MIWLIPILVFTSITLAGAALTSFRAHPVRGRLQRLAPMSGIPTFETDLTKPLVEKVFLPVMQRAGRLALHFTPGEAISDLEKRLRQADYPLGFTVTSFLATKVALVALPIVYVFWLLVASRGAFTLVQIVLLAAAFLSAFRAPDWWLNYQVSARKNALNRALPDALDLIVICTEAGLALEAAMGRVVDRMTGALSDELRRTLGEISLGKRRRDALRDLIERTEAQELVSFIAAVIQADQTGISVGNVLKIQANDLRVRRRQRAEKEGREAPMKMLFPNILFIFPATFIVLVGPAGLRIMDQFISAT